VSSNGSGRGPAASKGKPSRAGSFLERTKEAPTGGNVGGRKEEKASRYSNLARQRESERGWMQPRRGSASMRRGKKTERKGEKGVWRWVSSGSGR